MEQKTIKIECTGAETRKLNELNIFQGNLKDLSKDNFEKLKKEILEDGFSEPISIWFNENKWWILNGTQRLRVLQEMEKEGYTIPSLPVSIIKAKNRKQAARKCLALTSQYGNITAEGFIEFMDTNELQIDEIKEYVHFADLNINQFVIEKERLVDDKNLLPDEFEKFKEEGQLKKMFVIINYEEEQKEKLSKILGIDLTKKLYKFEDLNI